MEVIEGYYYTENHEWVKIDGEFAYVGITFFAQRELGEIVHVELPEIGDMINAGEPLGSLEAVKTVEDVFSPISGEVEKVNNDLEDAPDLINKSPYEDGWLVKIRFTNKNELSEMLNSDQYKKLLTQNNNG